MNESAAYSTLYGKGVFTTIAIRDGGPFLWDKHWRRLVRDSEKVGIDLVDHSEASSRDELAKKLRETSCLEGRARITFSDESESALWGGDGATSIRLSIITAGQRVIPKSFRLTISPFSVNSQSPLSGVKSCNYLENILALDEARERGFAESIRLNERGLVTGGCMANVFWWTGGRLFTPSVATGCLPGTTREYVLEHLDCEEGDFAIADLKNADAVFLTSAGIGIVAVAEIDGKKSQKYTEGHELFRELSCIFVVSR